MKKILFSLIIASAIVSCSDDIDSPNNGSDLQTVEASKSKSLTSKSTITYIAAENFETEFEDYVIDVLEDYPSPLITGAYNSNTDTYAVDFLPEAPQEPGSPSGITKVLCRGEQGTVNKCMMLVFRFGIGFGGCDFSTRPVADGVYEGIVSCSD